MKFISVICVLLEACPEEVWVWEEPVDLGYGYHVGVENLGGCVNETFAPPGSFLCEKFAGDHPDYYYGGTTKQKTYPKDCFVNTASGAVIYNTESDGASEQNDVPCFFFTFFFVNFFSFL